MTAPKPLPLRFVSANRRVREDRRFVAGHGRFVADVVREGMLHVALLPSPHPSAKILDIDTSKALKMPGVRYALTGEELSRATDPLMNGLDTPNVRRYPLAVGQVRYAGEWVVAVVADTRAEAEDAIEKVCVRYEPLPFVLDSEKALDPSSPLVHPPHGSNVLLDKTFVWGEVEKHFADSPRHLSFRVAWGRNSTVPIETFGVVAEWDPWREMLDVWASIQMPKYPDQIARALRLPANNVRVHQDVDVGGSYGVKRGIKHTVLVSHLSRVLSRPVRLIEDRLENMRAGDAHGPERIFDVEVAFDDDGIVNSMKMKALDNVGAYAGRSPFQLGKPIGAIVGPYKIKSVKYRAQAVMSNKAAQEAVRGFGQAPTNYAIETAIDKVASVLGLDRIEVRLRNFIRKDEFPYLIPSGTRYDSGDYHTVVAKVLDHADYKAMVEQRDALRASGMMAGIGIAACLEPSGGNSSFEPLLNEKNKTTTWMDSCRIMIDALGFVTVTIHTTSAGQGHESLAATVVGEVLEIDPDLIRVVRPDSLASLPSNTPVGSRMAIMLGGAAYHAAQKLKAKLIRIGAHQLACDAGTVAYSDGAVSNADGKMLAWTNLVNIAHRNFHLLPEDMEPGLEVTHVMQVPTGDKLPADGRVQMYPCHSFEFHLVLIAFDPVLGKPDILRYVIGHDCGTVINPHIVKGMTLGGIAHGLGAALLEEFVYDAEGNIMTQSFMDYLLPSSHEVPKVEIVHHCTPSPYTVFGQKGSGESGYLGSPAAISGALNDAVATCGVSFSKLPIRISAISDAIAASALNQGK
ncbi:xanthine dehydrogenase family protein molybdopterin-binding subunit [Bradyrhizobium sp. SHOUNA76]|uniref:xanthine dehydrogenase family protein molybdopterin-binding subunit n=1 Tax=Bradyrhizobium sp. SHOUNA76 TaxID=2908927 RepID=UPI001FF65E37|nr:xanthine dehydrogenase family protein molybdopterin-binding subunit [Bradyrhizobium sp. SHOUNA76]MCJ9700578.1 xanthine dehydrogenase family protein molybdopterin-binding subunit [Bradyrhizobium sp. SHOUNA76]